MKLLQAAPIFANTLDNRLPRLSWPQSPPLRASMLYKPYYSDLIDALAPLHVVQVAHHAGHNAHFYSCLLASKYPIQKEVSYLLLSHKTNDKKRPSDLFTKFIASLRRDSGDIKLLFTSHPLEAKVRDVKALIEKVVGGPPGANGDVRLDFNRGRWTVSKHFVSVH